MEEFSIYALIEINNKYNRIEFFLFLNTNKKFHNSVSSLYFVNLINTSNTLVYKNLFCTNTLYMTIIRRINSTTFWFSRKSTFWVTKKTKLTDDSPSEHESFNEFF